MPAPWEQDPKDKWKTNFEARLQSLVDNVDSDASAGKMAAGIANLPGTPSTDEIKSSQRFQNWQDTVDSFTVEALKQQIVAQYQGVPYDEASTGDFSDVLDNIADDYESSYADAWS